MKVNEYQLLAARTLPHHDKRCLTEAMLGLSSESGEVAGAVKAHSYHGRYGDRQYLDRIEEELGDTLWYIAAIATIHNISLRDIAERNIDKLRKRYPDGFSEEASRSRGGHS